MFNEIREYIKDGITISTKTINGIEKLEVFTIPTQHFTVDSYDELTVYSFKEAVMKLKERYNTERQLCNAVLDTDIHK